MLSEKLNQVLSLESLKSRLWFRKPFHIYKMVNGKSPHYLFEVTPNLKRFQSTRYSNNIHAINLRLEYCLKYLFSFWLVHLSRTNFYWQLETQAVLTFVKTFPNIFMTLCKYYFCYS